MTCHCHSVAPLPLPLWSGDLRSAVAALRYTAVGWDMRGVYCASRFKGVFSQDGGKTWSARTTTAGGKGFTVGTFETEEHAARAVDK